VTAYAEVEPCYYLIVESFHNSSSSSVGVDHLCHHRASATVCLTISLRRVRHENTPEGMGQSARRAITASTTRTVRYTSLAL
jgi:hypothetical protein